MEIYFYEYIMHILYDFQVKVKCESKIKEVEHNCSILLGSPTYMQAKLSPRWKKKKKNKAQPKLSNHSICVGLCTYGPSRSNPPCLAPPCPLFYFRTGLQELAQTAPSISALSSLVLFTLGLFFLLCTHSPKLAVAQFKPIRTKQ